MLPIKYLTIHCATTPEGRNVTAASIEAWDIQKFGQKSYHWIVLLDGTKHRSLADDRKGAHVGGNNTGNIGVCYVGGMDAAMAHPKDSRTEAQKQALREIVDEYRAKYPGIIVRGHRDWPGVAKACPSFDVASWLGTAPASTSGSATSAPPAKPVLKRGMESPDVARLQAKLGLAADGDFGALTEAAVKALQSRKGLAPDGIVGPKTWAALS